MLKSVIVSMRPRQWVKNTVVLAALVFAQRLVHPDDVLRCLAAFAVFCIVSGAAYLFNDVRDAERDRRHETKRLRPVASGELRPGVAMAAAAILLVIGLAAGATLGGTFLLTIVSYLVLNAMYSLWLRHIAIIDVMVVASGFLLRAIAGAAVLRDVAISPWLVICTIFLALFVVLGKRRHELVYMNEQAVRHRSVLAEYTPQLLDQMIAVVTTSTVIVYVLYTMWPNVQEKLGTTKLFITIPFVLYGIFRYLYLVHRREKGGSPEDVLFSDLPLLVDVLLWFGAVYLALYVLR